MKNLGIIRSALFKAGKFMAESAAGQALPPWDDYWYQRPGFNSASGMAVSPETAMRLSAVFSCVRVRSEDLASLPLIVYERTQEGGKRRAIEHPLYRVLHDAPNPWQTSLEFIEMMQAHLDLRGNAFARILPGQRGPIGQMIPLHPDLVMVYRMPDGRLKYQVRRRFQAEVDWYTQDEILHLRGLSSDGLVGLSPIAVQRETIGTGLAMQDHGARFFENDSVPPLVITYPAKFKDDAAREKWRESWQRAQTGANKHKAAVLENGMDIKALGVTNKDSQFLEAKQASAIEICGMYRVPPHKIGILDRATHSNVEQEAIEYVQDCVRNMAVRWERRINLDLIDPLGPRWGNGRYFAEFRIEGLLRGDLKSRMEAYAIARQWGLITPNFVAKSENWDPIDPDDGGDDYWRPVNMAVVGEQATTALPSGIAAPAPVNENESGEEENKQPQPDEAPADDEGADARAEAALLRARLYDMALEAAKRTVRKETSALRKISRAAGDGACYRAEAKRFYAEHLEWSAAALGVSEQELAQEFAAHQELLHYADGIAQIESAAPGRLAQIVMNSKLQDGVNHV